MTWVGTLCMLPLIFHENLCPVQFSVSPCYMGNLSYLQYLDNAFLECRLHGASIKLGSAHILINFCAHLHCLYAMMFVCITFVGNFACSSGDGDS